MIKLSTALARILTVGVLMAFTGVAAQQAYPNKPIRIITPYPPGGSTTIASRLIGQKLTESWGQQVLVDSRPGGNTIIGSEALVRSPPDGYTIMLTTSVHAANPSLIASLPYDIIKDFAAVATVSKNEYVLVLNPAVPANNLQEFIALAKSRPGQLNYATSGTGGPQQLAAESLSSMTGVKLQHIPYKGAGPVLNDLMGGQVEMAFMNPLNAVPHINSGQLKAIAVSGETRLPALPKVPTFTEAGLPGFEARNWLWIFAPARTPKEIIDKLSTEIAKILAMPDVKEKLASQGAEAFYSTPDQSAALLKEEIARLGKIIKTANIKLGN